LTALNIEKLLVLVDDVPAYRGLAERLTGKDSRAVVTDAAKPYVIAALYRRLRRPVLVITPTPGASRMMAEQLSNWLGTVPVRVLPEADSLPYQRAGFGPSDDTEYIEALSTAANPVAEPLLMVSSAGGLSRLAPDVETFKSSLGVIETGQEAEPIALMKRLVELGYRTESLVELPGQAARRGGILDLFPPTNEMPVRLEFFGSIVESIRLFEPVSQRSLKKIDSVSFGPANEMAGVFSVKNGNIATAFARLDIQGLNYREKEVYEEALSRFLEGQLPDDAFFYSPLFNRDNIFSYLPAETVVVIDDIEAVKREVDFLNEEADRVLADKTAEREVPAGFPRPLLAWTGLESIIDRFRTLRLEGWLGGEMEDAPRLGFEVLPSYAGMLQRWMSRIKALSSQGSRVIAVSHQAQRLADLLGHEQTELALRDTLEAVPGAGTITLVPGALKAGWSMRDTILFTDNEIFGFTKKLRQSRRRPVAHSKLYVDISPGDYVVHIEHGIGKFTGVVTRTVDGLEREYMMLNYAEGDRLYVPTDQIDRVSRYVGTADAPPALSRLGSMEWLKSKERAKKAAEEVAADLLNLYAERELAPGFTYSADNAWQVEMEASFPYVETPDQLTAIAQIKEDMARPRPMDRLVTGDVGYGKTEVALRAAFKAVMDGRQVAVLVPTTVLAQQHYVTFSERLAAFPVKVEMLSRFRSPKEQKEVIDEIAAGTADIVIGTHRLLQKDVVFKDLGLVVIDEEQRFGVSHKEHFKRLRKEVGVLTLSATPIPRTLHMSLLGVRDMSVMETPPEERLPIKTYVAEYEDRLVREAIIRELERNGQVYFVHNRVQSIGIVAEKLRNLVPEADIAVGHGQMAEEALESVMADFTTGKYDVLLCTTIIESGLDVPNANTLIVNHAEKMGLTQLYQLRGRVGRGASAAYAYFLYEKGKQLTEDAGKRLRTIFEATELGAGFGIAMKDMEIRGAGNILGVKQSGHIDAVGFSYYTQLLADAVDDLKTRRAALKEGKPVPVKMHFPPPTINLPIPSYISDYYVADSETKLSLYQSLAGTRTLEAVNVWRKDFEDRFGKPPPEVNNLLYSIGIKVLASKAVVDSVSTESGDIVLRRPPGIQFDLQKFQPARGIKVAPYQVRLNTRVLGDSWRAALEGLLEKMAG
jgi:transcription-repair coupling factor (superfamily II helicase)